MDKIKIYLPSISVGFALLVQILIPDSATHPITKYPYFTYFLEIVLFITIILVIISYFNEPLRKKYKYNSYFVAGIILFINILNIVTVKLNLLPSIYFPSLNKIIGVIIEDREFLITCILYSSRILLIGFISGALIGIVTGIAIGFSKRVSYWLTPIIRVLGPIPSTAWIPLVLISFPSTVSASTFLIGLAVWFPTTVMTSSGISNVRNAFFEVASTLGASKKYQIFKVGVPVAMPHIFLGIFNGTCASFITLMTAEMIGAKYGIGWYINWQKEMMSYSNVYAGLIIIAVIFSILITLLFKFRDKILLWQKGVIKW